MPMIGSRTCGQSCLDCQPTMRAARLLNCRPTGGRSLSRRTDVDRRLPRGLARPQALRLERSHPSMPARPTYRLLGPLLRRDTTLEPRSRRLVAHRRTVKRPNCPRCRRVSSTTARGRAMDTPRPNSTRLDSRLTSFQTRQRSLVTSSSRLRCQGTPRCHRRVSLGQSRRLWPCRICTSKPRRPRRRMKCPHPLRLWPRPSDRFWCEAALRLRFCHHLETHRHRSIRPPAA